MTQSRRVGNRLTTLELMLIQNKKNLEMQSNLTNPILLCPQDDGAGNEYWRLPVGYPTPPT